MATVGHILAGMAIGRSCGEGSRLEVMSRMGALAIAACLPDVDLLLFPIRHPGAFAHRGFTHSLCAAALLGLLVGLAALAHPASRVFALRVGIFVALAAGTHGLLDIVSSRGGAVMLFWPFSSIRVLAPLRPVPVAHFTSLSVFILTEAKELLAFTPCLLYAVWPRKKRP